MILPFFLSFCLLLSMGDGLKNTSEQFNDVQDYNTSPKEPCDVLCHLIQNLTKQLEERITRQIQMRDPIVAFTATARKDFTPLYLHQIIGFPFLITNIGGGYDTELSVFRCPVKGLYEFTVSIRSLPKVLIQTYILAAGVATVYTESSGGSNWDMTTSSVLLQLNKGDNVNVRVNYLSTASAKLGSHSTFSGYLIRAM